MLCWSGAFGSLYGEICYADAIFRLLRTKSFARNCLFDPRVTTSPRESHWHIRGLKVRSLHLGFRKTWNNVDMQNSYGRKYVCIKHACCLTRVCKIKCFSYHEKYMFQKISAICEHVPPWFCKVFLHFRQARRKTNDSRRSRSTFLNSGSGNQFRKRKRPCVLFPYVVALNNEWFVHVASSVSTIFLLSMSQVFIFSITPFFMRNGPVHTEMMTNFTSTKMDCYFFHKTWVSDVICWNMCRFSKVYLFLDGTMCYVKMDNEIYDIRWDFGLRHLQSTFSR